MLAALGRLPVWALLAAGALLVLLAAWVQRAGAGRTQLALAAWPPLHVLLFATGSADSPLIALAAAWLVALGRSSTRALAGGWIAAALLVPAAQWLHRAPPSVISITRYELLLAVAAGLSMLRRARPSASASPSTDEPREGGKKEETGDADADLRAALEIVRRATDAHEATLWRADGEWRSASLVARAAAPGVPLPDAVVGLEGSPYKWAVEEQLPQHVRRGKRDLPAPWAEEMLVVPVDLPEGVLALAYPGLVPPGADAAALDAARHLTTVHALLKSRGEHARDDARVQAIAEAARALPGEIEVDAFARRLAAIVRQGTGAAGVAVAVAGDEAGRGRVLVVDDTGPAPQISDGFAEGDSRLAMAMKHAVDLRYDDLRREREKLPLLTAGEQWRMAPRSAAVFPLVADGRALGAVAAWHPEPGKFGEKETELLRLLCSIAPMPLRSARQYEALDLRAHTDALTALPNRAAFEERLATLTHVFDRYARPFAVLVLDVDFFKKFNDTHGHEAGDRVLQHVAAVVRQTVRDVDTPARLGGEEFVVLMPETGLRASQEAGERLRRSIEARTVSWNGRPLSVTVSIGAASCPDCTTTASEVLKLADEALYRAKAAGRNRVASAPRAAKV
ncbi:sensor domain-containing diguanylate cyclase [Longimicrobium sp.]|uniref:GGDEF domain-containing protein n=1 Tax=Longimicrobium sp. TaxID=2029185 RepID=UPI002BD62174|nr:sensor domain-containing diguanylate cyclase [Longimicrobium sp.]HSU17322.1 sensor domain-containing diguanylate cyclase [Longimicrobium sp.]